MALQDKLVAISRETGSDIQRLYLQVAYSRFLGRLFLTDDVEWALKGGHALEIRLQRSRATKDLDLALRDGKIFGSDEKKRNQKIGDLLSDKARVNLGDYFEFVVSDPIMDLEAAPYGGSRFNVEAKVAGKIFSKFSVDIALGDVWLEPQNTLDHIGSLDEIGLKQHTVKIITIEQHISEKIHALTLPRDGFNSRVKDLVDLYLIFKLENVEFEKAKRYLAETFKKRNTHPVPDSLPEPPANWSTPLTKMMKQLGETATLNQCYDLVEEYFRQNLL